jgi:hypothetical protein
MMSLLVVAAWPTGQAMPAGGKFVRILNMCAGSKSGYFTRYFLPYE